MKIINGDGDDTNEKHDLENQMFPQTIIITSGIPHARLHTHSSVEVRDDARDDIVGKLHHTSSPTEQQHWDRQTDTHIHFYLSTTLKN